MPFWVLIARCELIISGRAAIGPPYNAATIIVISLWREVGRASGPEGDKSAKAYIGAVYKEE